METVTFKNGKAEIEVNEEGYVDVVFSDEYEVVPFKLTAEEAYELADVLEGKATELCKAGLNQDL